jgi:23S rRNA pseudouridine2605 synthase
MKTKTEKLHKIIAQSGIGSRREIEKWIIAGRVEVNGQAAHLGHRITYQDNVRVDGQPIQLSQPQVANQRMLLYYKPEGVLCSRARENDLPIVFDDLPKLHHSRWISVGRLDLNSEGLLLLTTDGEFANRLMHPSYQLEREYAVRVLGHVDATIIKKLLDGVQLDDGFARFEEILEMGGEGKANHWYRVTLREGRHREVRRLWQSQGLLVSRLIRIRFGNILLPYWLKPGKTAPMPQAKLAGLLRMVGVSPLSRVK